MDFKCAEHIKLLSFDRDITNLTDDTTLRYEEKFITQVVDMRDKAIVNAVIEFAKREGVTDLALLDAEFVKTALINEAERRKRKGGAERWLNVNTAFMKYA